MHAGMRVYETGVFDITEVKSGSLQRIQEKRGEAVCSRPSEQPKREGTSNFIKLISKATSWCSFEAGLIINDSTKVPQFQERHICGTLSTLQTLSELPLPVLKSIASIKQSLIFNAAGLAELTTKGAWSPSLLPGTRVGKHGCDCDLG